MKDGVISVPMPDRLLSPENVALARGVTDAFALKAKWHNPLLHAEKRPIDAQASHILDGLEQARVESLGAQAMEGVRQNLKVALESELSKTNLSQIKIREEVPLDIALPLLLRERMTGDTPPESAKKALELLRPWVAEKADQALDALAQSASDQSSFTSQALNLLQDLQIISLQDQPETKPTDSDDANGEDEDETPKGAESKPDQGDEDSSSEATEMKGQGQQADESEEITSSTSHDGEDGEEQENGGGDDEGEGYLPMHPARKCFHLMPLIIKSIRRAMTRSSLPMISAMKRNCGGCVLISISS